MARQQHVENAVKVLEYLLRGVVLHVPEWGWMVWDGRRWLRDIDGIRTQGLTHRVLCKYYSDCEKRATTSQERAEAHKAAVRACSTRYVDHVLNRLKEKVRASIAEFDTHPHLLNCLNCVVDLRDGSVMPHAPELRLTKLCPTRYIPGARSELWERFLEDVFLGNRELIAYMQRALGYSITGETREQKLFICYGTGANGKTTLFETLRGVVDSDYMWTVPMGALRRDRRSRYAETARTALYGVRLTTLLLTKLSEEKQLGKVLTKLFATGDTVTARYLYQKPFNFRLVLKPWLSTNYKPRVKDSSHVMLHRVVIIPFRAVFTNDTNVDPTVRRTRVLNMVELLLQEREAILAWLVEGAQAWYREGLKEPEIVRAAVGEYRREQKSRR